MMISQGFWAFDNSNFGDIFSSEMTFFAAGENRGRNIKRQSFR